MARPADTMQFSRSRNALRQHLNHSFGTITATSKTLVSSFHTPRVRTLIKALNTAWIVSLLLPLELVRRSLRSAGLSPLLVPSGDSLRNDSSEDGGGDGFRRLGDNTFLESDESGYGSEDYTDDETDDEEDSDDEDQVDNNSEVIDDWVSV